MPGFCFGTFLKDRRGTISMIGALSLTLSIPVAAIGIDYGAVFLARRNLQAATDAAALSAAQNPASANAIAAAVFAQNGYSSPQVTVTQGTYTADENLSASSRFSAVPSGGNAIRVSAAISQAGYFGLSGTMNVTAQSTAARVPTASFGAGTRLASLNAGVINDLLGQLWGSGVSLSLIDYQALLDSNIDALTFLDALAAQASVTGSYQQLANATITSGQFLNALVSTAETPGAISGSPAQALLALKALQLQLPATQTFLLEDIIDLSSLSGRGIGNVVAANGQGADLNLMSLLSASARTVASGTLVNLNTGLSIPIANTGVTARLVVGNKMAQVSSGKIGATVHTAQVRLALTVTVASITLLGIPIATVSIPLYLEAASGDATLTAMSCSMSGGTVASVTATSNAASLRLGTVSNAALQNLSSPVTPGNANIVTLPLLLGGAVIQLSGVTNMAAAGPTALNFTQAEIAAKTVKTVSSGTAAPFTTLSTTMSFSSGSGLLSPIVTPVVAALNTPVNSLLTALGLQLGVIDVQVFDASCRTPTLVG